MLEINKKEVEQMTDIFSARELEINNKLEAIRLGEEERRRKEKEIEGLRSWEKQLELLVAQALSEVIRQRNFYRKGLRSEYLLLIFSKKKNTCI